MCVGRLGVNTSTTWGGVSKGNEVWAVHLFSVEAVAESTAVGVCCWAVGEDQEVFVATVHEQGPLTASFDVVGPVGGWLFTLV